jgi:hypothetical protein
MFYSVDKITGKRSSLDTTNRAEACQQAAMNLRLARSTLSTVMIVIWGFHINLLTQ